MNMQSPIRTADLPYGSDQHGLIWGYRFIPGQPALTIESDTAVEFLSDAECTEQGQFLWLHFSISNSSCESWLRQKLNLPNAFYELLRSDVGSTRLEQESDVLVALIHDVLFDFTFDASAVATTILCIGRNLVVSARLRPLRSVDQLRAAVRAGEEFRSPAELLAHLLRDQASVLANILRQSTQRTDQVEDLLLANRIGINSAELGSMRRVLVRLQRLLAPEPASFFRLLSRPPKWISEEDRQDLQQAAEEFSSAVGDAVVLIERIKLLQEELAARVNEQTNRTLYVLTVVTVLALPINLVAGLFGMNVGGMPLSDSGHGFMLIVVLLLSTTTLLAWLALGRRRE
jgi:zinc transporter